MARRIFAVELDDKIKSDSIAALMKKPEAERLMRDAGYIQGLTDARNLFTEIVKANIAEEERS